MSAPPRRPAGRRTLTPERAWDYLLYILSRRMYTTAELRKRLVDRGIEEPEAERLVARLVELQLVNDDTYTTMYVASRAASRGRLGLKRELMRKGVAEELVDERLETLSPEAQRSAAAALLRKNAWRYEPEPPAGADEHEARTALLRARARAFAFLARRGFSVDAVQGALEDVGWFTDDG